LFHEQLLKQRKASFNAVGKLQVIEREVESDVEVGVILWSVVKDVTGCF
jgi:hypothetical protein